MNWSAVIWKMYRQEDKTIPEIIAYFDNPLVNKVYILKVLENIKYLKVAPKRRPGKKIIKTKPPTEGTKLRRIWDKVESIGGKDALLEILKTKTIRPLAKEWGFTFNDIINYKKDYVYGRKGEARFRAKVRYAQEQNYRIPAKRKHIGEKRNKPKELW